MSKKLRMILASEVNEDYLHAEILSNGKILADVRFEEDSIILTILNNQEDRMWEVDLNQFYKLLEEAKHEVITHLPKNISDRLL